MKTLMLILIIFLSFNDFSYAEETPKSRLKEHLKVRLYVSYLTSIGGTIEIFEDKLSFKSTETKNVIEKILYSLPSDSFKELTFDFEDIKDIYRRNTFLIFPNKFLLKTNDGKKYKFYSYQRKKILKTFRDYRNNNL